MRDYLAEHPHGPTSADPDPTAPLFPSMRLIAEKPTGVKATDADGRRIVARAEHVLAGLSVADAEARLRLDWTASLRHGTFYKAVYRPAVLSANRLTPSGGLPPELRFHALRHTYVSLCVAAGIPVLAIARYAGHSKATTTMTVYAHLFEDDHSDAMAALGAMATPRQTAENVVPIRRGAVG